MARNSWWSRLFTRETTLQDVIPVNIEFEDDAVQQDRIMKPIVIPPVMAYKTLRALGTNGFEEPEYDFAEISRASDIDGYLKRSIVKKHTLFFKEGYDIVGRNPVTVQYVRKRLRQIQEATRISTARLFRATAEDLITYSNCFWVLVRDKEKSGGRMIGKVKPIAGVFIPNTATMRVKTNKQGHLVGYEQRMPDGRAKTFKAENVIHLTVDRKSGFSVGTPRALPVLDDIRSLRRIEENIEMLIYKDIFPLYQYRVGTEKAPAKIMPNGSTEMEEVEVKIEFMPPEGIFVTPERHDIKAIGAEGRALRVEGYLRHFKQRVLSGLGISGIDVGETEGASKASGEVVSQGLVDEVKDLQDHLEEQVQFSFFNTLLKESIFKFDVLSEENMVKLVFKEIDSSHQIAFENHNSQMFQQDILTHAEVRERLGRDPMTDEEWQDSHHEKITVPSLKLEAQLKITAARVDGTGANRDRPRNQFGTKTEPLTSVNSILDSNKSSVFKVFTAARKDAILYSAQEGNRDWYTVVLRGAREEFKNRFHKVLKKSFISGFRSIDHDVAYDFSGSVRTVSDYADKYVDRVFDNISTETVKSFTPLEIGAVFDNIKWRVNFIYVTEKQRAFNYGALTALRYGGATKAVFERGDETDCEDCDKMSGDVQDVNQLTLFNIPPHHPQCQCRLKGL